MFIFEKLLVLYHNIYKYIYLNGNNICIHCLRTGRHASRLGPFLDWHGQDRREVPTMERVSKLNGYLFCTCLPLCWQIDDDKINIQ